MGWEQVQADFYILVCLQGQWAVRMFHIQNIYTPQTQLQHLHAFWQVPKASITQRCKSLYHPVLAPRLDVSY